MKTAFLFPGQGSQYVGMGKDLYENYSEVRQLYNRSEKVLGFNLTDLSFEGPEEELKKTKYTQPSIFVHSFAVFSLLKKLNITPHVAAGHSLGEYSALTVAEAITFEDGLHLVKLRGKLMQESGEKNPGTMAAVIGLERDIVDNICREVSVSNPVIPANYNSPGQIVISGSLDGVHKAMELAKLKNARLVSELVVSGAFHSPLMKDALGGLADALSTIKIISPSIPVYTNVTAKAVSDPEEIREALQKQLLAPVLWQDIIQNMIVDDVNKFYEIGPGKVLSGLSKRINREYTPVTIGTEQDLRQFEEEK